MANVAVDATLLARGMMFMRKQRRNCSEEDISLAEYAGRDLHYQPSEPPVLSASAPLARKKLQRSTSLLFEEDEALRDTIDELARLGDSINDDVRGKMLAAMKRLGDEDGDIEADNLNYETYKSAVSEFVDEKRGWNGVAPLFRFGDEVLNAVEENRCGERDVMLEQRLEDYNSRVLVDLASAFLSRAGGILGIAQ